MIAKVGMIAYKLELPVGSLIYDVFHVSQLKKQVGPLSPVFQILPPVLDTSTLLHQPKAILIDVEWEISSKT